MSEPNRKLMKYYLFIIFFVSISAWALSNEQSISGKVQKSEGCSDKAMIWLSLDKENYKERLLLMHTEVPVGGSFKFFVNSGNYQVRGSDQAGCEFFQKIKVTANDHNLSVKMVKK